MSFVVLNLHDSKTFSKKYKVSVSHFFNEIAYMFHSVTTHRPVVSFPKEVNPRLAQRPLKNNGR